MGGGGGKPQNIFKLNRGDDPKEVLNWRLWFAVLSFGIMGAARGETALPALQFSLTNPSQESTRASYPELSAKLTLFISSAWTR
jgi:hypothetical protein